MGAEDAAAAIATMTAARAHRRGHRDDARRRAVAGRRRRPRRSSWGCSRSSACGRMTSSPPPRSTRATGDRPGGRSRSRCSAWRPARRGPAPAADRGQGPLYAGVRGPRARPHQAPRRRRRPAPAARSHHPAARGRRVGIIAIRDLGLAPAGARLGALAADAAVDGNLRMEALTTLSALKALDQLPIVQDLITDDWPALRAAAIRANAAIDPDNFTLDPVRPRDRSALDGPRRAGRRARLAAAEVALPPLTSC